MKESLGKTQGVTLISGLWWRQNRATGFQNHQEQIPKNVLLVYVTLFGDFVTWQFPQHGFLVEVCCLLGRKLLRSCREPLCCVDVVENYSVYWWNEDEHQPFKYPDKFFVERFLVGAFEPFVVIFFPRLLFSLLKGKSVNSHTWTHSRKLIRNGNILWHKRVQFKPQLAAGAVV